MYVTAQAITLATIPKRVIPRGTRLSDVYEGAPGDTFYATAHLNGERIKIVLRKDEMTIPDKLST